MSKSSLDDRANALEGKFFHDVEQHQLDTFRNSEQRKANMAELAAMTSFGDDKVLAHMVELGVTPATLTAFSIIPMLHVAWSDNVMDAAERKAILLEATASGMKSTSSAYKLLEGWLTAAPNPELFECWKAYHKELVPHLSQAQRGQLREQILDRARRLARASGGMFGLGSVASGERAALQELETLLS